MSSCFISPLGDSALLIHFGNKIDEGINKKVLHLFQQIKSTSLSYIKDVVPAYSSIAVHYNVVQVLEKSKTQTAFKTVSKEIKKLLNGETEMLAQATRKIKIGVCYSAAFGIDLEEMANKKNIFVDEIISLHMSKKYRVYTIGFLPGFAYMGEVDEKIAIPRRQQPRTNIPAGSVGIAGKQTGIYPLNSPGGWQIIGRTPVKLFDKGSDEPVFFKPGDEVEFYSITEDEFENYKSRTS